MSRRFQCAGRMVTLETCPPIASAQGSLIRTDCRADAIDSESQPLARSCQSCGICAHSSLRFVRTKSSMGLMEPLLEICSLIAGHAGAGEIASARTGIPGLHVAAASVTTQPIKHVYA